MFDALPKCEDDIYIHKLVPDVDRLMQIVFPVLYKQVPEGLPRHLDTKHPDVDTAYIHREHEQNKDKGRDEEKWAVDSHGENSQDASSNRNVQVPADIIHVDCLVWEMCQKRSLSWMDYLVHDFTFQCLLNQLKFQLKCAKCVYCNHFMRLKISALIFTWHYILYNKINQFIYLLYTYLYVKDRFPCFARK